MMNKLNELEAIKARHSVRQYLDKPIETEKIEAIQACIDLEAALLAPTAVNQQKLVSNLLDYGNHQAFGIQQSEAVARVA